MYDFSINGVVDTGQSCMSNLEKLFTAAGAWITYDISAGKWSFTIKQSGSSVMDFNDTNIIGGISVSSTGITDLYNKCTISYPHKDLTDKTDQVDVEIPTAQRYNDEIDNTLIIQSELINDPIQAQFMATVELKQNRLDTVIKFTSDYTALGLKAGDIITVTAEVYGYSYKKFRVTSIQEDDTDVISVSISAMEYNDSVYDTSGLIYTKRDVKTGIIPKSANTVLVTQDQSATANAAANGFANNPTALNTLATTLANSAGFATMCACNSWVTTTAEMTTGYQFDTALLIADDPIVTTTDGITMVKISWNIENALCNGSRGPTFNEQTNYIRVYAEITDPTDNSIVCNIGSGGQGSNGWSDYTTDLSAILTKNKTYRLRLYYTYYSPERKAAAIAANQPTVMTLTAMYLGVTFNAQTTEDPNGTNVPSNTTALGMDYINIKFDWPSPGRDLDFKAMLVSPSVGQSQALGYFGSYVNNRYPATGTKWYMLWGGDDAYESPGNESIVVNVQQLQTDFPTQRFVVIACYAMWGRNLTVTPNVSIANPITATATLWEGGLPVLSGHQYVNPTATDTKYLKTKGNCTASYSVLPYASETGQFMTYFIYDLQEGVIGFANSLPY